MNEQQLYDQLIESEVYADKYCMCDDEDGTYHSE